MESCGPSQHFKFAWVGVIVGLTIYSSSIATAQLVDQAKELRLIGESARQLLSIDRPIECSLALPGVQSFLDLPTDKRRELEQIFVDLESGMWESYSTYQERLTLLKRSMEAAVKQELDEEQRDYLDGILDRAELATPLVNNQGVSSIAKKRLGFSWEKSQGEGKSSSLFVLTGGRAVPTSAQWSPSHISASEAIDMARRVWRSPLTRYLQLECPVWLKELELSHSQFDSLNAALSQLSLPKSAHQIEGVLDESSQIPIKQLMAGTRQAEHMSQRNRAYRAWAQQHLTPEQLNKITSLIVQNFEQNCPSASRWCLTGLLIPLSKFQQLDIQDIVAAYVEQEDELWQAHVDRCRQQIDQASQLANECLDHVEAAQYRRLLKDLALYRTVGILPPLKN